MSALFMTSIFEYKDYHYFCIQRAVFIKILIFCIGIQVISAVNNDLENSKAKTLSTKAYYELHL